MSASAALLGRLNHARDTIRLVVMTVGASKWRHLMKTKLMLVALALFTARLCPGLFGGTPAQDQEFLDKYKAAYEKGDKAALEAFLYTKDANPMALEFYKMMQAEGAGTAKISKIELVALTPQDVKKAAEVQTGPDGNLYVVSLSNGAVYKISQKAKAGQQATSTPAPPRAASLLGGHTNGSAIHELLSDGG